MKIYKVVIGRFYTKDAWGGGGSYSLYANGKEKLFDSKEKALKFLGDAKVGKTTVDCGIGIRENILEEIKVF